MEAAIPAQQFSAVSLAAREVDRSLSERIAAVEEAARPACRVPERELDQQQRFLEDRMILPQMFNWGVMILDAQRHCASQRARTLNRAGTDYRNLPIRPDGA